MILTHGQRPSGHIQRHWKKSAELVFSLYICFGEILEVLNFTGLWEKSS